MFGVYRRSRLAWWLGVALLLAVVLVAAGFVTYRPDRPPRTDLQLSLHEGISYTRQARSEPRPLMVHIVTVDLTEPGIDFLVTPGNPQPGSDTVARTTVEFMSEFGVQVAVNGGFFEPARAPDGTREALVNVRGLAMSDGQTYSDDFRHYPVLCLTAGQAEINRGGCGLSTEDALAGSPLLVENGQPATTAIRAYRTALHPRTAVAVDAAAETLWLIAVDGRQRGYSEGVTLYELADIAIELGADVALNLDGGGSTTLAWNGPQGPQLLNSPIDGRIPMRQRAVGNHLGIFLVEDTAQPSDD